MVTALRTRPAGTLKRLLFYNLVHGQLGKPYVWGGDTPSGGFDCSGLVKWAAGVLGITIPHYTVDQWNELPRTLTPKRGDLVYFYVPSDGPASAQPGHVGVCADDGCRTMVNAPQPGGVVDLVSTDPTGWGYTMGYRAITTETGTTPGAGGGLPVPPTGASTAAKAATAAKGNNCGKSRGLQTPNLNPVPSWVPFLGGSAQVTILTGCQLKALRASILVGVGGVLGLAGLAVIGLGVGLESKVGQTALSYGESLPGVGGVAVSTVRGKTNPQATRTIRNLGKKPEPKESPFEVGQRQEDERRERARGRSERSAQYGRATRSQWEPFTEKDETLAPTVSAGRTSSTRTATTPSRPRRDIPKRVERKGAKRPARR